MPTILRGLAYLGLFLVCLACAPPAVAEMDKENQGRWAKPTESGPDKEVPGFLVNLGPTGARAILTEKTLIVRYLFKDTPADGHLKIDDVITGVSGKPFPSYVFGGSPHGYEGPIMSFGEAIEHAEGSSGQLVLNVLRSDKPLEVVLHLEPIGAFAATFPMQCAKSTVLHARALTYLAEHPDSWQGAAHAKATIALALLTSGNPQQAAIGKSIILGWNAPPSPDTWTWGVSYQLIALSEYHLLTGDTSVLPTIAATAKILRQDQYSGKILIWGPKGDKYLEKEDYSKVDAAQQLYAGGFGHTPYIPGVGKDGYGPMQFTTILAVIGWQLAERCGVAVDPQGLASALEFIYRGTNEAGYVAYGGEFTLNAGLVDPVKWKQSTDGTDYVGRAGASLIAHSLSPEFPLSAHYVDKNRSYMKSAYKSLPDGHADPMLGFCWGLMGAGSADDDGLLRTLMDYHKSLFNMMRCADGSFVVLPGRNYADGGYYMSSRYYPTAIMALTLGLGNPKLMIQGIQVSIPGINVKALKGKLMAAYKAIVAKVYVEAVHLLAAVKAAKTTTPDDAAAGQAMSLVIDQRLAKDLATLERLKQRGDFCALTLGVSQMRANFGTVEGFKDKILPYEEALRQEPGKTQAKLGVRYQQLVANLHRLRSIASAVELEKFADKNPEGVYARWAIEIAAAFRVNGSIIDPSTLPGVPVTSASTPVTSTASSP